MWIIERNELINEEYCYNVFSDEKGVPILIVGGLNFETANQIVEKHNRSVLYAYKNRDKT